MIYTYFVCIASTATTVNRFKDAKHFITWMAHDRLYLKHMNEIGRSCSCHLVHGTYPSGKSSK